MRDRKRRRPSSSRFGGHISSRKQWSVHHHLTLLCGAGIPSGMPCQAVFSGRPPCKLWSSGGDPRKPRNTHFGAGIGKTRLPTHHRKRTFLFSTSFRPFFCLPFFCFHFACVINCFLSSSSVPPNHSLRSQDKFVRMKPSSGLLIIAVGVGGWTGGWIEGGRCKWG